MKKTCVSLFAVLFVLFGVLFCGVSSSAAETVRSAARVTTSSGRLNVRSGASTAYGIVGALERGSTVTVTDASGDWWRVEYADGQYGYCSSAYLTAVETKTATVSTGGSRLNIRAGAGTGYAILSQYADGAAVTVLSSVDGWAQVLFDGTRIGYVSETYLSYGTDGRRADGTFDPVLLTVPRYAQNDTRWAKIRLGNSYETVGSAGCTTCAMAMVETAVRGYSVTPDRMERELSYSSSGILYWPPTYSAYQQADYLSVVYRELRRGRPVMIGGFTPSGSQHWVVITGFTGGTLTAENFAINDPGTYARNTLAAFQSKYSVFYKIMLRA